MMQLALFGATGGTGEQIVRQALKAGHSLRLLVRDPAKLKSQDPRLTVITGNVLTPADVNETLTGADAVICTLGNTRNNPEQVVSNGTRNIISAMQLNAIRRLIVVSSLGVGDSKDQVPFFFKVVAATFLRKVMRDKEAQEELVRTSGLDLTDGPRTGAYQFGVDPTIRAGQVSRADVADFVLREVERNEFIGMAPAIT
jgi:putative NADH-flavin reductase